MTMLDININENFVLGIIPARGGSKSIPMKNLVLLNGRPLISYVINAAKKCKDIDGIVCSTDHESIAEYCKKEGVGVIARPSELCGDDVAVVDVMKHVLNEYQREKGFMPDIVPLLQPTSPFLIPEHISTLVKLMKDNPIAQSAQTIARFPHNYHAYNQRRVEGNQVRFCFEEERRRCYNKQLKPTHYIFGNLVISRAMSILQGNNPFGDYSLYCEISPFYALDIDGPEDLDYAEYLFRTGEIVLN